MRRYFIFLSLLLASQAHAVGLTVRGGGDPDAVQFLALGGKVASWLETSPANVSVRAEDVKKILSSLEKSLSSLKAKAKLAFTDAKITDDAGVEKCALFDRAKGSILVNRACWQGASAEAKYETAALELFGLAGSESRYAEALLASQSLAAPGLLSGRQVTPKNYLDPSGKTWALIFDHAEILDAETIDLTAPGEEGMLLHYLSTQSGKGGAIFVGDILSTAARNPCRVPDRRVIVISPDHAMTVSRLHPDRQCNLHFSSVGVPLREVESTLAYTLFMPATNSLLVVVPAPQEANIAIPSAETDRRVAACRSATSALLPTLSGNFSVESLCKPVDFGGIVGGPRSTLNYVETRIVLKSPDDIARAKDNQVWAKNCREVFTNTIFGFDLDEACGKK